MSYSGHESNERALARVLRTVLVTLLHNTLEVVLVRLVTKSAEGDLELLDLNLVRATDSEEVEGLLEVALLAVSQLELEVVASRRRRHSCDVRRSLKRKNVKNLS